MAVFLKVYVIMLLSICCANFENFVTLLKLRERCHARALNCLYSSKLEAHRRCGLELVLSFRNHCVNACIHLLHKS